MVEPQKGLTMAEKKIERILILAKTYPSPSAHYQETSCVAGINEQGMMRRLYPIPFRMLAGNQQFKKWQWIDVRIEKSSKDNRQESHKVFVDSIVCKDTIETKGNWGARRQWLDKIPCFDSFDALEQERQRSGLSLALLRPKKLLGLDVIKARNNDWTEEEKAKLLRDQMQYDLFSESEAKQQLQQLKKIPFDFYYSYEFEDEEGHIKKIQHKIVDWETGALYWNCKKSHGMDWEKPFRQKLEQEFRSKDLMFLMGNLHRFQHQWLIISLIYPPMQKPQVEAQGALF